MREFDHERMEVYRRSLEFVRTANSVRGEVVSRRAALADQLDRAAVSITLNIAEGAGEFAKREKARFYRIARRSATECAGILDIVAELQLADEKNIAEGKEQLRTIVAMLVGLGKWLEQASDPEPQPKPVPKPSEA
jgi:four helix bundle protein